MTTTRLPKTITAGALLATPIPPVKWIIPGLLPAGLAIFAGPSKAGKSWLTLAKYIEHWAADIGPKKLANSTYQRDLQDVRRILPALGNYKLTDLRKEVIRDFYEEMRHSPRFDGRGNLSEKSVEGLHNTLCGILSAAVDEGYLTHNPAWRCYKPKGQKKERPVADEETVKKLITAFEGQSMKYETYFKLVLATGLRRGEACGLKWSDINWRKRTIHVQRGVVKLSHQESITKDPKTTSGDRMVYLSKEMCQLLKAWRKECEWDRQQTANETVSEDDYLFRQPNGKPMNPCTFTYRFKLILKANNLPLDLNVHSLRHPYVKHTTKKYNSEKQKTQATKIDLIAWVFRFVSSIIQRGHGLCKQSQCGCRGIHTPFQSADRSTPRLAHLLRQSSEQSPVGCFGGPVLPASALPGR